MVLADANLTGIHKLKLVVIEKSRFSQYFLSVFFLMSDFYHMIIFLKNMLEQ